MSVLAHKTRHTNKTHKVQASLIHSRHVFTICYVVFLFDEAGIHDAQASHVICVKRNVTFGYHATFLRIQRNPKTDALKSANSQRQSRAPRSRVCLLSILGIKSCEKNVV